MIEISGSSVKIILPRAKHETQVAVSAAPIIAVDVATMAHTIEIVEVNLVDGFKLFWTEVQFISHLVCKVQRFSLSVCKRHGVGRDSYHHQHCQGK
jgi:hypothetical protein